MKRLSKDRVRMRQDSSGVFCMRQQFVENLNGIFMHRNQKKN